jgi:hypothetical protein
MGHSFGDGVIVAAIAAALVAYLYFQHVERRRRLDIIHQERLVAMDKGIPLPELPLEPVKVPRGPDPHATLVHGIVWTTLGIGSMAALALIGSSGPTFWPLPLPLAFMGIGLILYYALASERSR